MAAAVGARRGAGEMGTTCTVGLVVIMAAVVMAVVVVVVVVVR